MAQQFDPIFVEVIKNELAAVTEEMAIAVSKTARSAMVKIGDFAATICDGQGRLIGPGYAAPFQLAIFQEVMAGVIHKWRDPFRPGDVLVVNDPYAGMGHMPDVAVITPVFWEGQVIAFTLAYSHHTDTGGRFAGGFSSQCTESFEEGMRLPAVKLYTEGRRNEALLDMILANVRTPEEWLGDVEAKVAGCWRGAKELQRPVDKYGLDTFTSCCDHVMDHSEQATRAAIQAMPDGRYEQDDIFEDDGFGNAVALKLKVALEVAGDTLTADFTGTDPQAKGAINMPLSMTKAMVYGSLKLMVSPDILLNSGFVRPMHVAVPLGSLLNPRYPAAVGGRASLAFRVSDMVFRALAQALPDRVPIVGEGGDVLHFVGRGTDGQPFAAMDGFFGGWGARPYKDGIDGVTPMTFGSYGTTPAELLEREHPLVVEGFGYVPDSGGPGKYRGSVSVYRQWRFLQPGTIMVRTNRPSRPCAGLAGGQPGAISQNVLNPQTDAVALPRQTHLHLDVKPGDRVFHAISGSGGHGDPWDREPALVLKDVHDEKVTLDGARQHYGVIIDPHGLTIDWERTRRLRQSRAGQKPEGAVS
ncbi:MAG: hydantoinase B/oxoprolinase family protein [Deltaproteobacteria bacterium]|nr:hydantoinase B/oxoprolinase family protein [Deltaproteobacteria bacterium]